MSKQLTPEQQAELRERLAALQYQEWARGTSYFLGHLSAENLSKWDRQCRIPYGSLSERDKNRVRELADKILNVMHEFWEEIDTSAKLWRCENEECGRIFWECRNVPGGLECPFCQGREIRSETILTIEVGEG